MVPDADASLPDRAAEAGSPPRRGLRADGGSTEAGRALKLRLAAGAGLFLASLAILTLLGLYLTRWQEREWRVVVKAGAPRQGTGWRASLVPMQRLRAWREARGEVPESVKELDGATAVIVGFARPVPAPARARRADGLWLVAEPYAATARGSPPLDRAVWIDLPRGVRVVDVVEPKRIIRAGGVLRVGLAEVPGVGPAAYRLDLDTLWVREAQGGPGEDGGHVHGPECDHGH